MQDGLSDRHGPTNSSLTENGKPAVKYDKIQFCLNRTFFNFVMVGKTNETDNTMKEHFPCSLPGCATPFYINTAWGPQATCK